MISDLFFILPLLLLFLPISQYFPPPFFNWDAIRAMIWAISILWWTQASLIICWINLVTVDRRHGSISLTSCTTTVFPEIQQIILVYFNCIRFITHFRSVYRNVTYIYWFLIVGTLEFTLWGFRRINLGCFNLNSFNKIIKTLRIK